MQGIHEQLPSLDFIWKLISKKLIKGKRLYGNLFKMAEARKKERAEGEGTSFSL